MWAVEAAVAERLSLSFEDILFNRQRPPSTVVVWFVALLVLHILLNITFGQQAWAHADVTIYEEYSILVTMIQGRGYK